MQHALALERLWFRGRYDLLIRLTGVYELNRDFSYDAFNVNLIFGTRVALP